MKWETIQFGSITNLVNGRAFKPSDWSERGVPIIRIQNLNGDNRPFNYWAGPLDKQVRVRPNDVLLAWSGTPGTSFGTHIWRGGDAVLNQHIFRVDLDETRITKEWAVRAVNFCLNRLIDLAHGGVGLKHVTREMVETIEIILPPLPEQRRIAEVLDQAEALRAKRRAALAQLDTLTQAIFFDLFGDPIKNTKSMKIEWLGNHLLFVTSGGRGWAQYYAPGGNRFIRSLDVQMNHIGNEDTAFVVPPDNAEAHRTRVKAGDVLLTITGSRIGRVAPVPDALEGAYIRPC